MPQLFIANVSLQHQEIQYVLTYDNNGEYNERMAKRSALREVIPYARPSRQQVVGGRDLHETQISEIVEQLEEYGLISEADILAGLFRGVHPIAFNIGRPVSASALEELHANNTAIRTGVGRQRREALAVATNNTIEQITGEAPRTLDLEFEQEAAPDMGKEIDSATVAEGFHVTNDPAEAAKARKARAA